MPVLHLPTTILHLCRQPTVWQTGKGMAWTDCDTCLQLPVLLLSWLAAGGRKGRRKEKEEEKRRKETLPLPSSLSHLSFCGGELPAYLPPRQLVETGDRGLPHILLQACLPPGMP